MAGATIAFNPGSSIKALLEQIYAVKFSKHVPLLMILLFAIFAVWRTDHYVSAQMHVGAFVSAALAVCIEIAMLAAGASCFIAMREAYIRELRKEDAKRASLGSYTSYIILAITTIALMTLAGADGAMESKGDLVFILLMIMIQFVQSGTMLIFISTADLEEREKLRVAYAAYTKQQAQIAADEQEARDAAERQKAEQEAIRLSKLCPYCSLPLVPNNRARHMRSCPNRPAQP